MVKYSIIKDSQMAFKTDSEKKYMAFLAFAVLLLTFAIFYVLLTTEVPVENQNVINVALGVILGLSSTIVTYYFGSSKGSSDKSSAAEEAITIGRIISDEEEKKDA